MQFKDLENGMAVKTADGKCGIVFIGFMSWDYIKFDDNTYYAFSNKTTQDKCVGHYNTKNSLTDGNIVEVRSIKGYCTGNILYSAMTMFTIGVSKWKHTQIEEMTLEQVCKELGRDIKIIKG